MFLKMRWVISVAFIDCRDSTSDSDSDSKWKTADVLKCLDEDDSYDGSDSEENDFRSKERLEMSRMTYRWAEWVSD